MGLITVLCMMFAGVLGVMYVKEKDKNQEAAVKQAQLEEEVVAAFAGDNTISNNDLVRKGAINFIPQGIHFKNYMALTSWGNDHASILFP